MMRTVPLGDIATIESGSVFPNALQGLTSGDYPFAKVADISQAVASGTHQISRARNYVSADTARGLRAAPFPTGTIVFAKIGEAIRLNNRAITTVPMLFDNNVMGVTPNLDVVDVDYLFYFLRTLDFYTLANVTAIPALRKSDLADMEVPCPTLPEQRQIAARMKLVNHLRRTRRYALQLCDEFLPAAFLQMFANAPADWPTISIGELGADAPSAIRTGPFGSQLLHSEFTSTGIAVLGIDNAVNNRFEWSERRYISPEKYAQLKRYTVRPGDVIITIMGTCGRCAVVPLNIPLAINTKHLCCITLDHQRALPRFLQAAFLHHPGIRKQLGASQKGAIMDGLNMEIIKGLRFQLPPLPRQQNFVDLALHQEQTRATHVEALRQADHLFQTLLHNAFVQ
jgi:type I restriction enzyme S subunit